MKGSQRDTPAHAEELAFANNLTDARALAKQLNGRFVHVATRQGYIIIAKKESS